MVEILFVEAEGVFTSHPRLEVIVLIVCGVEFLFIRGLGHEVLKQCNGDCAIAVQERGHHVRKGIRLVFGCSDLE